MEVQFNQVVLTPWERKLTGLPKRIKRDEAASYARKLIQEVLEPTQSERDELLWACGDASDENPEAQLQEVDVRYDVVGGLAFELSGLYSSATNTELMNMARVHREPYYLTLNGSDIAFEADEAA